MPARNPSFAASRPLSMKLLGLILLFSSMLTLLFTALQLWLDYRQDVDSIEERFTIIERTTLESLTNSVWALNEDQIGLLLEGMINLDAIRHVELVTDQGQRYAAGTMPAAATRLERNYRLLYRNPRLPDEQYLLGTLAVQASLEGVYQRLIDRTAAILVTQAVKTFLVSMFILLIVQALLTRHLGTIADYARSLSLSGLARPLRLQRRDTPQARADELGQVETAVNQMRERLLEDIAARETAEQRLRQSEVRYRQLFDTSMDGLAIFELDGRLVDANRAYLDMLGYSLDEARDMSWQGMTPPKWLPAEREIVETQILGRGYSDVYEKEYIRRDGSVFPVSVRGWIVRDDQGRPRYLMGTARDISREKSLEAERTKLQEMVQERQRLETVGTLAGGVAHDFNNLLTPIKGYAEMLEKDLAPGTPAHAKAEAIFHAAERGRKLVEKILLFSRRGTVQRAETDLEQLVRETIDFASLSKPRGVKVQFDSHAAGARVHADATQMHQVVMNLVINAFHAMPDGGTLHITLDEQPPPPDLRRDGKSSGSWIRLMVEDNGSGIAPEHIDRIFEPFFTTRETGKGSGLGLAVVHGIVESHDGLITVDSRVPGGTRFSVWLPRMAAAGSSPAPA
jgi:PAS domain S-box-containing protein